MTDRPHRKALIESAFSHFFEFPEESDRNTVTATSAKLFAEHMMEQAEAATLTAVISLDPHHAKARLVLANLAGAVSALANEIVIAGGYRVADPARRERVDRAMAAVSAAHAEALALPPVTDTGD